MTRKQSFLGGAFVLALAGLLSKVLGALYRIPLYPMLGQEGMGLFQMAYPAYGLILVLSTTGINVAVSKIVSERLAVGDRAGAWRAFRHALILLTGLGLVFSFLLFLAAEPIARFIAKDERAWLSIAAVSPAIFFVSVMAAYRGLFQGLQQMTPTALSQVIEQLVRVATMLALASFLAPRGVKYASAGATFGAVTGAVAGLTYLLYVYCRNLPQLRQGMAGGTSTESAMTALGRIMRIAIPVSMASGVLAMIQFLDLALVPTRLEAAGFVGREVTALFGQMSGGALPLINMPTVLTAALQVSLVPAISEGMATGSLFTIRKRAETAVRVTFLIMLPAVVGLFVLADEIPALLFRDPGIGVPLAAMSAGTLFLALQQTSSGVLQGMGQVGIPVRNLAIGAVAKGVATYYLTGLPALGIRGAALGTVIGFLVAASLNLTALSLLLGPIIKLKDMIIKPGLSALIMGVGARLIYDHGHELVGTDLATVVAIAGGAGLFGLSILVLGGVRREDVEWLPVFGPSLGRLLGRGRR